ncbi:MAG: four helix bundle protein [Acidobacteria bacterium]|nr:four helix bundle protein [Acidobacteriota bacterium]
MQKTNFENLEIYQLSEKLADEIWSIVFEWNHLAQDTVGKQLIRSTDSIGANIAEGSGRGTDKDYSRFLKISRGSLYETRHWLRRAYKRKLLVQTQINGLSLIINELTPKLNAYIRSIGTFNMETKIIKDQKPKT